MAGTLTEAKKVDKPERKRTSLFANFYMKFNLEAFSNHCDSRIAFDFIHKFKLFCKSTCIMLI